ncbi:hypothetical protein T4B_14834 [Trichinella pseudospiralis]|uniref:Uncharacterized protein n=1 Tax=Trichinella pseudospiralis TaxID=6337 RepID=A0A0V1I9J4_TRIPS|nr:hypothetical protein T4B_14834 [Trichinella pseudospiralis]
MEKLFHKNFNPSLLPIAPNDWYNKATVIVIWNALCSCPIDRKNFLTVQLLVRFKAKYSTLYAKLKIIGASGTFYIFLIIIE